MTSQRATGAGLRTIYRPEDIDRARHHATHTGWGRRVVAGVLQVCRDQYDLPPERLAALVPKKTPLVSGHCPECGTHFASAKLLDRGERLHCDGCGAEWPCDAPDRSEDWDLYGAMRSFRLRHLYLELDKLGLAWQLTGERVWAERAAAVVRRFAEVFKGYRLNAIHRNVWLHRPHPYWGRIDGWKFRDGLCVSKMLLAYDLVRDSGALTWDDQAAIDRDLVRHAVDYFVESFGPGGYLSPRAMQDMGHACECIALGAAILGDGERLEALHGFFRDLCSGAGRKVFFPEDGAFYQGTFSYAMQLLKPLTSIAEILRERVYADPACALLRQVYTWPLDTAWPDGLPAALNDSHVGGRTFEWETRYAQIAWYRLGDHRGLKRLHEAFGAGPSDHGPSGDGPPGDVLSRPGAGGCDVAGGNLPGGDLGELFLRPCEGQETGATGVEPAEYADRSTHLAGLRFAALRCGPGRSQMTMAFLDYGRPLGHHHNDFLNIGLWAQGRVMLSEMGYKYQPRWILDWCRSPMAHNLVLELAEHRAGRARSYLWHPGPHLQAVEAGLPGETGRRLLALVPTGRAGEGDEAYLVDLFWAAAGGEGHTWVQHATTLDLAADGDLRDAAVPEPLAEGRQRRTGDDVVLTWRFDGGASLRTWMAGAPETEVTLATCPAEEGLLATHFNDAGAPIEGTAMPRRSMALVRRREEVSCFAAVHEPCGAGRLQRQIRAVEVTGGQGAALEIRFERDGRQVTDRFIQTRPGSSRRLEAGGAVLTGRAAWWRRVDGQVTAAVLLGGRRLVVEGAVVSEPKPRTGAGNSVWRSDDERDSE